MSVLDGNNITDDQIRMYGDMAMANGNYVDVKRAHMALAVPPVSWDPVWVDRAFARTIVAWDINREDSPYAALRSEWSQ